MTELSTTPEAVQAAHKIADESGKKLLETLYPTVLLNEKSTPKIVDFKSIKTFKDACEVLGINEDEFFASCSSNVTDDEVAYKQLKIVAKALNGDWTPNWADSNEYKYFPWFDMRPGFAFSDSDYDIADAGTYLGSRLCYKSSEIAKYAGDQFTEIYQQFLTLNK